MSDGTDVPGTGGIRDRLGLPQGASDDMVQGALLAWEKFKPDFVTRRAERERQQAQPLDTSQTPNFDALRKWIDKLEKWCGTVASERDSAENDRDELEGKVENVTAELESVKEELGDWKSMEELVADMHRGIRTVEELYDEMGVR